MSKQLINVVLDLETLSTREDAAILQIGCCIPKFDRVHIPTGVSHEFEVTISYETAKNSEFHLDSDTMYWWELQDIETRKIVFSGQNSYPDALEQFCNWIKQLKSTGADVAVWGNGSDFDNRLLTYTLDAFGYHKIWDFRNNRDLRTLKALFPVTILMNPEIPERKHTALGDARFEARIIDTIRNAYITAERAL